MLERSGTLLGVDSNQQPTQETRMTTTKPGPTRGAKYRAAKSYDGPYATYQRLHTRFERLLEAYSDGPRPDAGGPRATALRRAAHAVYLWDTTNNDITDKDRAERTIEVGSWEAARHLSRAFDKHIDEVRAAVSRAAADQRGDASLPDAITDVQWAAQTLLETRAYAQTRAESRERRLLVAQLLSKVAQRLVGDAR
jgi:hypothetical protein